MTNAERIRSMTNSELLEFLGMWEIRDIDYSMTFCDLCEVGGNLDCDDCRKHWLESSADAYNGINSYPSFKAGGQE